MHWLQSMRNVHVRYRGWNDIAQNITTFPDGRIGLCRPMEVSPACISYANKSTVCLEHVGNFDIGQDIMSKEQREIIIFLNALLCLKFSLKPTDKHIVFHHWFDLNGKRFSANIINKGTAKSIKLQKSCPGTGFFGGNTISSARKNFLPLINDIYQNLKKA